MPEAWTQAGIQGWKGKPGRLPAEETLQFEKRTPPIPHKDLGQKDQPPLHGRLPADRVHRCGRLQTVLLPGMVGIFCGGVLIFKSKRLRFFKPAD